MTDPTEAARALLARLGADVPASAAPPDVAAALAAEDERSHDRATRKEIRRALYRLRERGVPVPERAAEAPARAVLGPSIEAWVSAVDGRGDRLVWLARERPGGDLLLVAADLNEPEGLRDLRVFDVTRKQLRRMRERFQAEGGLRFASADWRAVDALVVEAADRLGADADRRLDYRRTRPRLTSEPPRAPAELQSPRLVAPTAAERDTLVAASASLASEPEFRTWWPRPDVAAPFLAEIREVRESPIVVGPVQQEERLRAILARAAATLFPPASTARRLRATAYVLAETGRVAAARHAIAVASALDAAPARAADVPLLQAFVHQALGTYLAAAEAERREARAGSLVVTPDEVRRAESPSRPPRARG